MLKREIVINFMPLAGTFNLRKGEILNTLTAHLFALATPFFAALSQIIIKWQLSLSADKLESANSKILFLIQFFLKPWVIIAFLFTFLAGTTWVLAMSKLPLSQAYPYIGLSFVFVPLAGVFLFSEIMSQQKLLGTVIVIIGIGLVILEK